MKYPTKPAPETAAAVPEDPARSNASPDGRINRRITQGRFCGPFCLCESAVRARTRLTQARLRELLHYDPETGEFRWLERPGSFVAAGRIAGGPNLHSGYWHITVDGRNRRAHQLAWLYMTGRWGRPMIDHRDGNPANNRWDNLRCATRSENNANRPCNETIGRVSRASV